MNEEIQKQLLSYMEKLQNGVDKGGEFVIEQTPLYVQELISWHFWVHIIAATVWLVVAIMASIGGAMVYRVSSAERKKGYKERSSDEDGIVFCTILFAGILWIASILTIANGFYGNITEGMKAHIAPRVLVVESLGAAIKGVCK